MGLCQDISKPFLSFEHLEASTVKKKEGIYTYSSDKIHVWKDLCACEFSCTHGAASISESEPTYIDNGLAECSWE